MTGKKHPMAGLSFGRLTKAPPDSPIFKRGWIVGGNGYKMPAKPLSETPMSEGEQGTPVQLKPHSKRK